MKDIQITDLPDGDVRVSLIEPVPGGTMHQVVNIVMKPSSLALLQIRVDRYFKNQELMQAQDARVEAMRQEKK